MTRSDDHIHVAPEADAADGRFERTHADARRLDRQVFAGTSSEEIHADAFLRIAGVGHGNRILGPGDMAHGVAEEKIGMTIVLERVAEVGALHAKPRESLAERRLMALFVLFPEELINLDGRAGHIANDRRRNFAYRNGWGRRLQILTHQSGGRLRIGKLDSQNRGE